MAYCPNIDCPHRKRTGNPAEFREGVTHCSDCGTELITSPEMESLAPVKSGFSDLTMRIMFTLSMIVVWRLISIIPVAGIDFEALDLFVNSRGGLGILGLLVNMKIAALGIAPYITAYVLVELSALFLPDFKAWRADGPNGRTKLRKWALIMTFFIAFVLGYGNAVRIEELGDGAFVLHPGIEFRLMLSLTMTTVVFLFIWTTDLVTRRGIGHGISILILSGISINYFTKASSQIRKMFSDVDLVQSGFRPPFNSIFSTILFAVLFLVLSFAFIIFVERSYKKIPVMLDNGEKAFLPVKLTAAGFVPAVLTPIILSIPVTFCSILGDRSLPPLVDALFTGWAVYLIAYFPLVIVLYFFLAAQFNNPGKLTDFISARNAEIAPPSGGDVKTYVNKSLKIMAILGALYLCAIVFLHRSLFQYKEAAVFIGGLALIKMVAISKDVFGEFRARKQMGKLIKVRECHDIPKAGYLKSVLETHGIPCHLKGYYHRALYYIFGPYLEISVMVPEERHSEAVTVAEKYF